MASGENVCRLQPAFRGSSRPRFNEMPEPIEAEFASPPIFSPEQEKHIQHAPLGDLHDDVDVSHDASPTTTAAPSVHQNTAAHDIEGEAGEKFTLVEFEPGTGENPKEWGKGKKW